MPKRYVDAGGLVTVHVDYADPQADLPSLQKAPNPLLPAVAKSEIAEAAGLPASTTAQALLTPSAPSGRLKVEDIDAPVAPVAGFQFGTRTLAREPIGGVPKCEYLDKWKKRWATIGTSHPLKGSKSWLTYTSSTSSSFGTAVSLYGGSFKSSSTRTLGDDWGQNFASRTSTGPSVFR